MHDANAVCRRVAATPKCDRPRTQSAAADGGRGPAAAPGPAVPLAAERSADETTNRLKRVAARSQGSQIESDGVHGPLQ